MLWIQPQSPLNSKQKSENNFEKTRKSTNKKKIDFSKAQFFHFEEGLCVQCLHVGSYDSEPDTINEMKNFANSQGYEEDFSEGRFHHEIYLSDPRKVPAEKLRTVIRHPVKKSF